MRAEPSIEGTTQIAPDPGRPEFLQGLLDSLRDGVVALDSGSRIIEWNKGAANIFGFNRDEVLGRPLDALIAGPRKREAAGLTARVMRQGREVADFETVRYAKDGTAVEVGISVSPIEAGGEVRGSVGIYKDITAWKNRESRLKHTSRLLRAIGEINQLIIRALLQYYRYYGDSFMIECPTRSGVMMNLFDVSREISNRLIRIFLRGKSGKRPVYGDMDKFQTDPHWRDNILFFEYFHGDNGTGLGASHQTGWTGTVAKLIQLYGNVDSKRVLEADGSVVFVKPA